jgi:photosystem II stability/assembly factor-like uncharacterized protein
MQMRGPECAVFELLPRRSSRRILGAPAAEPKRPPPENPVTRAPTRLALTTLLLAACSGAEAPVATPETVVDNNRTHRPPSVTVQTSGTTRNLIAVSPLNERVVWAAGAGGTYVVTTDGGRSWKAGVVPGADSLQFRDVEAKSAREAYLLSIGSGTDSRIYHTANGGRTWELQFTNQDPAGFYDCFAFFEGRGALVMGDAIGTRFPILRSNDERHWRDIGDRVPAAQVGEAGFASSGTCMATVGNRFAWFATGGASPSRVVATRDRGDHWESYPTPLRGSPSAGVFSVAFRDRRHGIVAGGDLDPAAAPFDNIATSRDGGATWEVGGKAPIGTIYGIAYAEQDDGRHGWRGGRVTVVATSPLGTAWSSDEGGTWTQIDGLAGLWAVAFTDRSVGWAVGINGQIVRISFGR